MIKPTAAASVFYNAHNPLLDKVKIRRYNMIPEKRETQADQARRERMEHAEEIRQKVIRNKFQAQNM